MSTTAKLWKQFIDTPFMRRFDIIPDPNQFPTLAALDQAASRLFYQAASTRPAQRVGRARDMLLWLQFPIRPSRDRKHTPLAAPISPPQPEPQSTPTTPDAGSPAPPREHKQRHAPTPLQR